MIMSITVRAIHTIQRPGAEPVAPGEVVDLTEAEWESIEHSGAAVLISRMNKRSKPKALPVEEAPLAPLSEPDDL